MHRLTLLLAVSLAWLPSAAQRQEAAPALLSAQADLLNTIHAKGSKPGDTFFIRTDEDWQQGGCTIRAKTLITGVVERIDLNQRHVEWGLRFEKVPCQGSAVEFRQPLLIALQAVHIFHTSALSRLSTAGLEDQTIASLFAPSRPGGFGAPPAAGSGIALSPAGAIYAGFEPEASMVTGEVRGLRGTRMQLPASGTTTTLISTKSDVFVDRSATFVLMLAKPLRPTAASEIADVAPLPKPALAVPAPVVEEPAELCAAGKCSFLSGTTAATSTADATWSVSLAALGFQARPGQMLVGLERSASVFPLGEQELLLTFDTHALHRRESTFGRDWKPRTVRAVVLSRVDGRVLLVRDWTVSDDLDMPVWSMGNGDVIAHVGRDLVDYGPV